MISDWGRTIESCLGYSLLPELQKLYAINNGERFSHEDGDSPVVEDRPMRLMTSFEVIEKVEEIKSWGGNLHKSCPFWIGWNYELGAVYLDGPLSGRVYFYNDDCQAGSVAYRSTASFLDAMESMVYTGQESYEELPTDYLVDYNFFNSDEVNIRGTSKNCITSDRIAWEELRSEFQRKIHYKDEDPELYYYIFNLIALTPIDQTDTIIEFLHHPDIHVPERAAMMLAYRKYSPAVRELGNFIRNGQFYGQNDAIKALGAIGNNAALEELISSLNQIDATSSVTINALRNCGCIVQLKKKSSTIYEEGPYKFQLPGENSWRNVE